ncbi:MAG: hypothetical protein HZB46_01180 [Solirubrobacterales bacterium]|nr:hypothetical protein [Solirubrobacterales bacterium]
MPQSPSRNPYRRLRRLVGRTFFGLPFDGTLGWTLQRPAEGPSIDIVRFGACETREAELSHTVNTPIGWPRYLADQLGRHGIGVGWQSIWTWNLGDFPKTPEELWKRRRRHRGQPDLVLIQAGGWHAIRHVLGFSPRVLGLRENVGVWLGRGVRPAWRGLSVWLQVVGRLPAYQGTRELEEFLDLARQEWPDAQFAIQELLEPALAGMCDPKRVQQINDDLRALAERRGIGWVPRPDLGTGMRLRCANGVNLNRRGSELAARHYARWILDNVAIEGGEALAEDGRPPLVAQASPQVTTHAPHE